MSVQVSEQAQKLVEGLCKSATEFGRNDRPEAYGRSRYWAEVQYHNDRVALLEYIAQLESCQCAFTNHCIKGK